MVVQKLSLTNSLKIEGSHLSQLLCSIFIELDKLFVSPETSLALQLPLAFPPASPVVLSVNYVEPATSDVRGCFVSGTPTKGKWWWCRGWTRAPGGDADQRDVPEPARQRAAQAGVPGAAGQPPRAGGELQ